MYRSLLRLSALSALVLGPLAFACTSFGTDSPAPVDPSDAAPLEKATVDARADANARGCTKDDALNVPSPIAGVGAPGQSVRFASLTRDELTIYFARATMADGGLASDYQIVRATRDSRTAPFSPAQALTWSSSGAVSAPRVFDLYPSLVRGDSRLYFNRQTEAGETLFVVDSTKPPEEQTAQTVTAPNAMRVPGQLWMTLSDETDDGASVLSAQPVDADGSTGQIVRARVLAANELGNFEPVPGLHVPGTTEYRPFVRNGGAHIYFSSNRARDAGPGNDGYDVYVAVREAVSGQLVVSPIPGLGNPGVADLLDWVSEDECRFYFSRRENGVYTILVSERSR